MPATKKKPAPKKKVPNRPSSMAKKSTEGKGSRDGAAGKARRQTASVLLFFGALLLLAMVIIPGGSLWGALHRFLLGLFGVCAYILPALMIYIAVIIALDKPVGSVSGKLWQCVSLIVMVASAIHIFTFNVTTNYFSAIGLGYTAGKAIRGGGVTGVLLGYPLEYFFTDVGAKIIIILLIAVFLMLVTGTTIITLLRAASTPVKKAKQSIETAMIAGEERRRAASIDIDLGEGYGGDSGEEEDGLPAHPVRSQPAKNEKLEALGRAARELQEEQAGQEGQAETDAVSLLTLEKLGKMPDKLDIALDEVAAHPPVASPAAEKDAGAQKAAEGEKPDGKGFEPPKPEPPRAEDDDYHYPPIALLDEPRPFDDASAAAEQQSNADLLVKTLKDFGINTRVVAISRGPAVTRYELEPSAGVKISRITGLADDIALRLAATGVRIEAPIPGKAAVGIEVPNKLSSSVCLRELIDSAEFSKAKGKLTVALGKDISGSIVLTDLAKMPHLLIAGTTGSGKSVCTNSMIQSVLYRASPKEVRMLLIDPKQVEFGIYNGIPHLLVPVVTDPRKAAGALGWAVTEMLNRYKAFAENNVRDLASYNELAKKSETLQPMPLILIVIDELADLMMAAASEVEDAIIRLAQMARAAGMHLVIATQRPSVDVITGLIKANIPSRLALTVASSVDSRTILDTGGAEKLLGKGDMLFMPVGLPKPMRVQGCFVSNREVESVVQYLKSAEEHEYDDKVIEEIDRQAAAAGKGGRAPASAEDDADGDGDEMLPQAIEIAVEAGSVSTSMLQRRLRIGYARAGRLIDEMEQKGYIGPTEGSKPRQVLITRQQWVEMAMNNPDAE
ncbi:MAG TPA: DNA translocase FtsK [Firmicutes bacterium]|nr:DNA translocase FtsK [Bacillota bacterium]